MHDTLHAHQRMSQRGITKDMVALVLDYGKISHDKATIGRKDAQELLARMQREMRTLKKILDKGGLVVIADNESVITTYNYKR